MTLGRTSSFSKPLFLTVIWLAGFLPVVRADCWIDVETNIEHCDGLSSAARLGIGLAFFFLFFAILMSLMIRRRRRNAQANLAFIQQAQPGNQFGNNGGSQPFPPQYPPQAYNSSPYVYDPATGFAPPTTSPPHYAPPPGVPPISSGDFKGGVMA